MSWLNSGTDEWDDALDAFGAGRDGTAKLLNRGNADVMAERQTFYEAHPWTEFRTALDSRSERTETRKALSWTMWFSGLAFATSVAVALLILVPNRQVLDAGAPAPTIRTKGGNPGMVAPNPSPAKVTVLANGVPVRSGDVVSPDAELVFRLNTGAWDHVLVYGVDQTGAWSPYYPDAEDGESMLIGRGKDIRLDDSVRLDGTVGFEAFTFVLSARPLDVSAVRGGMRFEDAQELTVWLRKER